MVQSAGHEWSCWDVKYLEYTEIMLNPGNTNLHDTTHSLKTILCNTLYRPSQACTSCTEVELRILNSHHKISEQAKNYNFVTPSIQTNTHLATCPAVMSSPDGREVSTTQLTCSDSTIGEPSWSHATKERSPVRFTIFLLFLHGMVMNTMKGLWFETTVTKHYNICIKSWTANTTDVTWILLTYAWPCNMELSCV